MKGRQAIPRFAPGALLNQCRLHKTKKHTVVMIVLLLFLQKQNLNSLIHTSLGSLIIRVIAHVFHYPPPQVLVTMVIHSAKTICLGRNTHGGVLV